MIKAILISLSLTIPLYSLEYGLDYKVNPAFPIKKVAIFGERNSGTNYLQSLIEKNFPFGSPDQSYGHKHFPWWFERPLSFYHGPEIRYTYAGSENYLFIVIFRNAYDWLRSMRTKPYGLSKELRKIDFSSFIRKKWLIDPKRVGKHFFENPWVDRNPLNGSLFKNAMKLRKAKIRTMLEIKNHVQNIYYINYEILRDNPEEVLAEMANLFSIQKQENFQPIIYYKGKESSGVYKKTVFKPISKKDLHFINQELDSEFEKKAGYKLIKSVNQLP